MGSGQNILGTYAFKMLDNVHIKILSQSYRVAAAAVSTNSIDLIAFIIIKLYTNKHI